MAAWYHRNAGTIPIAHEAVFGIVDQTNKIVGAFVFNNYNYSDIELHFFGPGILKTYIVREMAARALLMFRVNRMTLKTKNDCLIRGLRKLGAHYEGTQRRFYGSTDADDHATQVFVLYREALERLAGVKSG